MSTVAGLPTDPPERPSWLRRAAVRLFGSGDVASRSRPEPWTATGYTDNPTVSITGAEGGGAGDGC